MRASDHAFTNAHIAREAGLASGHRRPRRERLGALAAPARRARLRIAPRSLYTRDALFRSTIDMARHGFGRGEYRYFKAPLPPLVARLRAALYPPLAEVARAWAQRLGRDPAAFPTALPEFLARCHAAGQRRPTPLLLRYRAGDWNALHQDTYGAIAFPLQVLVVLSERGRDYEGGEVLLVEQRPRAQSRATAFTLARGDGLVFTNRERPVKGTRGDYRVHDAPRREHVDARRARDPRDHLPRRGVTAANSPLLVAHGATLVTRAPQQLAQAPHHVADGTDPEVPTALGVGGDVALGHERFQRRVLARRAAGTGEDRLPLKTLMRPRPRLELIAVEQLTLDPRTVQHANRVVAAAREHALRPWRGWAPHRCRQR